LLKKYSDIYWVSARFIDSLRQNSSKVDVKPSSKPEGFFLYQNYPNPFYGNGTGNISTEIKFTIQNGELS
jgi:hypothetical protein